MKRVLLFTLIMVIAFSTISFAKDFDLGKAGSLEISSFIGAETYGFKSVDLDLYAVVDYKFPVLTFVDFRANNTFVYDLNNFDEYLFTNTLQVFADVNLADKINVMTGVQFDKEWDRVYFAKAKLILY